MLSTDQSHLRKYLATLGVAIIAGTLSLAGLFFKIEQDLLVTNSELARLTPVAQRALTQRQQYLEVATRIVPWFALVGVLAGFVLSIYGISGWAKRQRVADEREDAERDKIRAEVRAMTDLERVDKIDRQAAEEAIASNIPDEEIIAKRNAADPIINTWRQSPYAAARTNITVTEAEALQKLRDIFRDSVSPHMQAVVNGRRFEVDALITYPNSNLDVIFEVKYSSPKNVLNRIVDGITQIVRTATIFDATGVLLIVVSDEATHASLDKWREDARGIAAEFQKPPKVLIIRASDFSSLSPEELLEELGLPQP